MELRDYLSIIARRIWWLIIPTFIILIAVYVYSTTRPVSYDSYSSINVIVTQTSDQQVSENYFNYDSYYAWQASSLLTDTVKTWFSDPTTIKKIYENTEEAVEDLTTLGALGKSIGIKKQPPSTLLLVVNNKEEKKATAIAQSTIEFIKTRIAEWKKEGLINTVSIYSSEPLTIIHRVKTTINLIAGLVAGIIIGLALIFLSEYLFKTKNKK